MSKRQIWLPFYAILVYLFLYLPIMVLILFSFNDSGSSYRWTSFTMKWYYQLLSSHELWHVLKNSVLVASVAASLSVLMSMLYVYYGTMVGLTRYMSLFLGVVALPDIIIAVSLLMFFMAWYVDLGFITLIIGHTLLGLGFAVPLIATRFQVISNTLIEAAMDLGATPAQTLCRIIIPLLFPSLLTAFLLVFMVSLDDFLISFFCSSSSTQTLSLYVFSLIRSGSSPLINALSTLILVASSFLVLGYLILQHKDEQCW